MPYAVLNTLMIIVVIVTTIGVVNINDFIL